MLSNLTCAHEQYDLRMVLKTVALKICNIYSKKKIMAPFYGWGLTASQQEPLQGSSLLFITKFPEIPGTHFIKLGRVKG